VEHAQVITPEQATLLEGSSFLRFLSAPERARVLEAFQEVRYSFGQTMVAQGDEGDAVYVLAAGRARVVKTAQDGSEIALNSLRPGDHFGEMALVDRAPRSASATAEGGARLIIIRRKDFYDIIRNESKLSVKLLWSFVQVLTQRLRKTTADLSGARQEASLPDLTDEALFDEQ
jgi:PPM family protein phosphatase